MGVAAECILEVDDDDFVWDVAGQALGRFFSEACILAVTQPQNAIPPSPTPDPTKSPSPNLCQAKDSAKHILDAACGLDDADSEDLRSTVGGTSHLAEDSRSVVDVELSADIMAPEFNLEVSRAIVCDALLAGAADGSLLDLLQEAIVPSDARKELEGTSAARTNIDDVKAKAQRCLLQALEDGGLVKALRGISDGKKSVIDEHVQQAREAAKQVLIKSLDEGSLGAALADVSKGGQMQVDLMPRPPLAGPPAGGSPKRKLKPASGSVEQVVQLISDADRRVGSLHVQIAAKERQIQEREAGCQVLTHNINQMWASLEHLAIDLRWHQDQILDAENRGGRLIEDRRALALKLDEMRLGKDKQAGAKQADTMMPSTKQMDMGRSLASTATGGPATGASTGHTTASGWNAASLASSQKPSSS